MGQVYVVPLKHVVEQVKLTFGTSKVSLYTPNHTSPAARTTNFLANTIELNNETQALVPYRYNDLCLSSQTKALHSAVHFGSQEGRATKENSHQQYTKPFGTCKCACGRRYDDISASSLSVEEFFRNATRPTSRLEVLTFWSSMLEFIRPRKSMHSRRGAVSKDYMTQKTLVCHGSALSVGGVRSELMSFPTAVSDKSRSQSTVEWKKGVSRRVTTSNEIARITPATSQEHAMFPCRICQARQNLQGAYYLFSIGDLLLESFVWVLAGHDSLNDLQQRRRDSNVSLADQGLQMFNKESVSLHAKAVANGDSTSLEVLQLTERILNQDLDFPELWRWQQKISEELERGLNMMRRKEPNFLGKRTSNKRALDSFIVQNFARNPVVDPNRPNPKSSSDFRALVRRVGHSMLRALSRSPIPPIPYSKSDNAMSSRANAVEENRVLNL
jgi:hypothetical protein